VGPPAAAKPAPTSKAKVAPWPMPPGVVLTSAKISPTSLALARIPPALPVRSRGALAWIVRLLGD
jgi:hypothetical protein